MFWAFAEVRNVSGSITPNNTISASQAAGSARRCAAVIGTARRGARRGLAALGDPRRGQLGTGELARGRVPSPNTSTRSHNRASSW